MRTDRRRAHGHRAGAAADAEGGVDDRYGRREGRHERDLAIKVVAPNVPQRVVDAAIQMHGGAGVSDDFPLTALMAYARILRLADGPDEVHRALVAKLELRRSARSGKPRGTRLERRRLLGAAPEDAARARNSTPRRSTPSSRRASPDSTARRRIGQFPAAPRTSPT